MIKKILILILLVTAGSISAQIKDLELGSSSLYRNNQSGYFDLSKPNTINIEINVWGFVKYPGRYLVPQNTTILDLISYAGGPNENAELDHIRIFRTSEDGKETMFKFDYEDLLWNTDLQESGKNVPPLEAGDVLSVPGSDKYYTKDYITMIGSVLGTAVSIAILIITINK